MVGCSEVVDGEVDEVVGRIDVVEEEVDEVERRVEVVLNGGGVGVGKGVNIGVGVGKGVGVGTPVGASIGVCALTRPAMCDVPSVLSGILMDSTKRASKDFFTIGFTGSLFSQSLL